MLLLEVLLRVVAMVMIIVLAHSLGVYGEGGLSVAECLWRAAGLGVVVTEGFAWIGIRLVFSIWESHT